MKTLVTILLPLLGFSAAHAQNLSQMTNPTAADVAAKFAEPPPEYSSQVTWGWGGAITREVIARDLDKLLSMNLHAAWVEPGRNPAGPYLSPAYFDNVKIAVEEAKKRNMRLWFDDDGGYPSGFAGGKFSEETPDLRMRALTAAQQVPVPTGTTYAQPLGENTICALAYNQDTNAWQTLAVADGKVNWTAPAGNWTIVLPQWQFRSGPTRSANNSSGQKDTEHSLMDYLDPKADAMFREWTFDQYKKAVGDEFGKTFLGFRGDEPAFGFNPWSPNLPAEFMQRKGYDIRPWLPAIAAIQIGRGGRGGAGAPVNLDAAHRAFADYCDVWSDLFGENFFSASAKWCADNNVEMQMHIEHEEILPQLAIADGDYFKCMQDIQIPGIDVIWHQVWHDVTADYPKLASSAAHLSGHPQSMSESFAAMSGNYPTPNLEECGWILNHQMVLGVTHFEYMFMSASTGGRGAGGAGGARRGAGANPAADQPQLARGVAPAGYRYLNDPNFPALAAYVNRVTYVLSQGRPAAQIGLYIPSSSYWFGDSAADAPFLAVEHGLMQNQRDLDIVDETALSSRTKLVGGELVNFSGQGYRAIIVPPVDAISQAALDNLRAFAKAGGKVIFLEHAPTLVMGKNFLTAKGPADISWATLEPTAEVNAKLLADLPPPDVALDQSASWLKYNHRHLKDAEVYFFFNEGPDPVDLKATVAAAGQAGAVQIWDAHTGQTETLAGATRADGKATVPLKLAPWETKLVVVSAN